MATREGEPVRGSEGDPEDGDAEREARAVEEMWAGGAAGKDVRRLLEHFFAMWRRR
jgi:hypothetical protein